MAQARTDLHASREVPRVDLLSLSAQALMLRALEGIRSGHLELHLPEGTRSFGDPASSLKAVATIHDPRTFRLGALRGEVGLGEAYVEGLWSSPDPVAVVRLAVRNMAAFDGHSGPIAWLGKAFTRLRHLRRANTREGSRQNIAAHYDLGNDFYRLWLDESMAYSCAFFSRPDAGLDEAQGAKFERICRRLRLTPADHLLEIGTGWGGFALHAASRHGCRVTTTTISREQFAYATEMIRQAGLADRVTVLLKDYRDLEGGYDKAVSIEMFEAVGLQHYDAYFAAVDRLLKPGGSFLIQTITMNERRFSDYIRSTDWIQQYVFPGAELASLSRIQTSLTRATDLSVFFLEDMGPHYARTLELWRARFHQHIEQVQALGFDARFQRLWDWYLASCEGAFRERYIGVVQMLIAKNGSDRALLDEPWGQP
jgi:cyclopropane-fatty-acyl-phospholipid synthase